MQVYSWTIQIVIHLKLTGKAQSAEQIGHSLWHLSCRYGPPGNDIHSTKNILAFPGYCTVDDLVGFPPCAIVVNEFDPLRDEGIDLYRKLLQAGPSVPIFTELEVTW